MIVQTAPEGVPHFVMRISEHTALSDQFSEAFGNTDFEPVEDRACRYIIANHDAGWTDFDAEFRGDPYTDYPDNLAEKPFELIMGTNSGSNPSCMPTRKPRANSMREN